MIEKNRPVGRPPSGRVETRIRLAPELAADLDARKRRGVPPYRSRSEMIEAAIEEWIAREDCAN